MQLDDTTLRRATDGDVMAQERLMETVWPLAFRIAWGVLRDAAAAQDCAQDSCVRLLSGIAHLRDPRAFFGWFYRIVYREAIARLRKSARNVPFAQKPDTGTENDVVDRIDLQRSIAALPISLRFPLIMHYYAGLDSAEIARIMGIPAATVRFRLMLARRRLRGALGDQPAISKPRSESTSEPT